MIQTVIFDLDNTLFNYDISHAAGHKALEDYCSRTFGVSGKDFARWYLEGGYNVVRRVGTDTAAIHCRTLRFQAMLELKGFPLFPYVTAMHDIYWDGFLSSMQREPYIREFLTELRASGLRTGIGTDMTSYIQYRKLEVLSLGDLFDFVVTSEEAGIEKPNPGFFSLVLEKAGCAPDQCLFIGDNPKKDIAGAAGAGMISVLYTKGIRPETEPDGLWTATYENFREHFHWLFS